MKVLITIKIMNKSFFVLTGIFFLLNLNSCRSVENSKTNGVSFDYTYTYPQKVNHTNEKWELQRVRYNSEGLEITGFILKPVDESKKRPLIVYNRGGNQDFGSIDLKFISWELDRFVKEGYVVVASQYRGGIWSEGVDEFGGGDVNDVIKITEIASELPYVDKNKIGVVGVSRGGLMSYLVSKNSDIAKAYVAISAPVDLISEIKFRPEMYNVYYTLIGDTTTHKQEYIDRSAVYWPEQLNEPLLVIHGNEDTKVSFDYAQQFVNDNKTSKPDLEYYWLEGVGHRIRGKNRDVRDSLIFDFLDRRLN